MRIAILAPGSRGDIQPYLALGKGLKDAGHTITLISNQTYAGLVAPYGLDFHAIPLDMQAMIEESAMRKVLERGNPVTTMAHFARQFKAASKIMAEQALEASRGSELIIAGFSGIFIAMSIAEKLGIQFLQAYNVPLTSTGDFSGALLPRLPAGPLRSLSHFITRQAIWMAYAPADKIVRTETLGLTTRLGSMPFPAGGPWKRLRNEPALYGISPSVIPRPKEWSASSVYLTGYWFLDESAEWKAPDDLERFLASGPAPVYIGFGSMSNESPEETAKLVLKALELSGHRGIVFSGWGGMASKELPASVHMIESTPHSWLFPRMAAVVHHGGGGTTAAGYRAGLPSLIVPFHGDQAFWGLLTARLGVGPRPLPRRRLSAEALASSLTTALTDAGIRSRAAALGERIRSEDGVARAVEAIEAISRARRS
ncbi:MAG: glycosyltransferase [Rectinemataceae bacterium]